MNPLSFLAGGIWTGFCLIAATRWSGNSPIEVNDLAWGWFMFAVAFLFSWLLFKTGQKQGKNLSPWEMQRFCMMASGQQISATPRITRDALLYYALILEEVSEGGESLMLALNDYLTSQEATENPENFEALSKISQAIHAAQMSTHFESTALRTLLKERLGAHWGGFALTLAQATSLADDTTDIQVVNSGFALAVGIPGELCYQEGFGSNMSKVNPDTGVIDKTPDGKWIKGRNYYKPNLAAVLQRYFHVGTFSDEQVAEK